MLEAHHLMFTVPDNQPLENLAEPRTGSAAFKEQLPGSMYSEAVGEQTVMVKVEPNREDFQTVSQAGTGSGSGAPDQSQLWTSGTEKGSEVSDQTVCVLLHDVKYPSPTAAAANKQQGYTPPIKDLPFLDDKEKEEMMHSDQYSVVGMQSRNCGMTLVPELQDQHVTQEVAVKDYSPVRDKTQGGVVFEFSMIASGNHEDSCGGDATGQNCFICSSCGQSFDSFSLFQMHQCKNITEPSFTCEICGKVFNQMSILKLHLKLHVE